jgi:hypothetical protein
MAETCWSAKTKLCAAVGNTRTSVYDNGIIQLFKYEGYERDEHRMEMSVKGINNDKSKLITSPEFCRIAIIGRALACYI